MRALAGETAAPFSLYPTAFQQRAHDSQHPELFVPLRLKDRIPICPKVKAPNRASPRPGRPENELFDLRPRANQADGAGRQVSKAGDTLIMGTGNEGHPGPGSQAVSASERLGAPEGDGVHVDDSQPRLDGGTGSRRHHRLRAPRARRLSQEPGARAAGRGEPGGEREALQPGRTPAERAFSPPPAPRQPSPPRALGDHLRPSPPPLSPRSTQGPLPWAAPELEVGGIL